MNQFTNHQTSGDDCRESGEGETKVEHDLKILTEHFSPVDAGIKRAELRKNDRNYQQGDILNLCEWDGHNFTGRFAIRLISHVADVSAYLPGYVLLSMKDPEPAHDDLMWLIR